MTQARTANLFSFALPAHVGAILALLFATTAWGGLFHAGKHALATLDPYWFTTIRYIGATLLLMLICISQGPVRWSLLNENKARLFTLGVLGYGMFGILVFVGLSMSVPSHGAVIMATLPLTSLFMRWILDRQTPAWWAWLGGLLAMAGVSLVSGVWFSSAGGQSTFVGDLIAWFGTIGWALYTRGQSKLPRLSVIEYTAFTALMSLPALFAIALLMTWFGKAHLPTLAGVGQAAPALLYIVIVGTVLAALAFNKGVRTLGPTNGILFINMVPVSALIITAFQGVLPSATEFVGTVLVVAALVLIALQMRQAARR